MGALLIVPVLASVVVIMEYLRHRILGLPPFDADGEKPFVAPLENIKPHQRSKYFTKRKRKQGL
jgi:hypothetical protein